jgi:hypothetical protein
MVGIIRSEVIVDGTDQIADPQLGPPCCCPQEALQPVLLVFPCSKLVLYYFQEALQPVFSKFKKLSKTPLVA